MKSVNYTLESAQTGQAHTWKYLYLDINSDLYDSPDVSWPEEYKQHPTYKENRGARAKLLNMLIEEGLISIANPEHSDKVDLSLKINDQKRIAVRVYVRFISTRLPQGHSWQPTADRIHMHVKDSINRELAKYFEILRMIRIHNHIVTMHSQKAEPDNAS